MFDEVVQALAADPVEDLTRRDLADRFARVRGLEAAVAAYRARLVRAVDGLGDAGLDGAGMLRAAGGMSSRVAAQVAKTAARLEELPATAEALATGRITAEHATTVARAAARTSPQAADSLVERPDAEAPADVFARRAGEWVATQERRDTVEARLARQRRDRSLRRWTDVDSGMRRYVLELDPVTGAGVDRELDRRCEQLWRDDGGRGGTPDEVRSAHQRMADAMVSLLTEPRRSTSPPHPKAQITVVADLRTLGGDPAESAVLVHDGRPLPQAVLERLGCDATVTGVLFDGPGRPLWAGRDHRTASIQQWKALIARDRGCVGCGADPNRCEAHHIRPWWEAWGPTDIDNLVLVCSRCHHDLHDRGARLVRADGGWRITWADQPRAGPPPPDPHQLELTA